MSNLRQEQLHGGGRASRGTSAGDIGCLRIFYSKCVTLKMFDRVKIKVEITKYNVRDGPIRCRISISIKVIL